MNRRDGKAKRGTAIELAAVGTFIGDILRDGGGVGFCPSCRKAEMPGAVQCGKCGGALSPAVKRMKQPKMEAA